MIQLALLAHDSRIERIAEYAVYHASVNFPAVRGTESFFEQNIGYVENTVPCGGVEFEGPSDMACTFRVHDDCLCNAVVRISNRRMIRPLAIFQLSTITAFYIGTQIAYVLIRHAKVHSEHEDVIARRVCRLECADFFDNAFL